MSHIDPDRARRFLDGSLPEKERARAEKHVGSCADCQAVLERSMETGVDFSTLRHPLPPAGFTVQVLSRIDVRERERKAERGIALAVLVAATAGAAACFAAAGQPAWVSQLASWTRGVAEASYVLQVLGSVLPAIGRGLRVEIALFCAVLALPLLFAMSRLVPRQERVSAR